VLTDLIKLKETKIRKLSILQEHLGREEFKSIFMSVIQSQLNTG